MILANFFIYLRVVGRWYHQLRALLHTTHTYTTQFHNTHFHQRTHRRTHIHKTRSRTKRMRIQWHTICSTPTSTSEDPPAIAMHTHTHTHTGNHRLTQRTWHIHRVGQNRVYTPHMTVYLVISLPELPYINRIYIRFLCIYGSGQPYKYMCKQTRTHQMLHACLHGWGHLMTAAWFWPDLHIHVQTNTHAPDAARLSPRVKAPNDRSLVLASSTVTCATSIHARTRCCTPVSTGEGTQWLQPASYCCSKSLLATHIGADEPGKARSTLDFKMWEEQMRTNTRIWNLWWRWKFNKARTTGNNRRIVDHCLGP